MKIYYLLSMVALLCAGCAITPEHPISKSLGVGSQALDIEAEVFDIKNARKILATVVQKTKQRLTASGLSPSSVEGLALIHQSLKDYGFVASHSTGVFSQNLITRGFDCSDYTLVYLEIAQECNADLKVAFAPNHIMVVLETQERPVFWETVLGRERSPLEFLTNNAFLPISITNGAYLVACSPQDALASVYIETGIKLKSMGKGWQAEAFLWRAVAKHPHCVNSWFGLGRVLAARKSYREAEFAFKEALSLDPGYPPAIESLENLRLMQVPTR